MDPAARLLRLLSLFQARPRWSARELAEELGVDRRTIRRDVTRLRDLGYPVNTTPGQAGYELGAGGRLPPLLLDDDEAVAIAVGARLAATAAVAGIETAAVAAMAKIDQVLPAQARERLRSLDASTIHVAGRHSPRADPDILTVLAKACRGCERIRFTYRSFGGATTERRAEPFRIVHTNGRWYLVALDLDRDDWRTFRVDRIGDAVLTGHRFVLQDPPDVVEQVSDAVAFTPDVIEAEIDVDLAPEEARRVLASYGGVVEATAGGRSWLRITGSSIGQLARDAAVLPCAFEVIGPPELRAELRRLGQRLTRAHGRGGHQREAST